VYFGPVEIRNWQVPGQEQVLTYPLPPVRLTNGVPSYLHRDQLGSIRAITDATGARVESAIYKPFGEQTETLSPANLTPESKGWIGQQYDADAGLQYLNARYYDPVLGLFLQPDWFEVLKPGVGTNRFSYSFNDPVNFSDRSGDERLQPSATKSEYASRMHDVAAASRDLLGRDITAKKSLEARLRAGQPTGWWARNVSGGWSEDERTVFRYASRIANGRQEVSVSQIQRSREQSEHALRSIGAAGSGVQVEYSEFLRDSKGNLINAAGSVRGLGSERLSWHKAGITASFDQAVRTFIHEVGHASVDLKFTDELRGYGGPASDGVVFQSHLGYWSGYRWGGVEMARQLGSQVQAIHNDTWVCSTLIGSQC
jgi:RHS repeat-associated protein